MPSLAKTVQRSFRLTEKMEDTLRRDAKERGISLNAMVTSILQKYTEWDRYADRYGFVTVTRNGWRMLIDAIDDEKLASLGTKMGLQNPREMTLFWYKKLDIETFLAYLSLISRYSRTMTHEVANDGSRYTITLQMHTGPKEAILMGTCIDQAIRTIVGVAPKVDVGPNSVIATFTRL